MKPNSTHSREAEEHGIGKCREISELRYLYLALNDEIAFEQAVLERGKNLNPASGS